MGNAFFAAFIQNEKDAFSENSFLGFWSWGNNPEDLFRTKLRIAVTLYVCIFDQI